MSKKITAIVLALSMLLCFAACGSETDSVETATSPVSYTHLDVYKRQALLGRSAQKVDSPAGGKGAAAGDLGLAAPGPGDVGLPRHDGADHAGSQKALYHLLIIQSHSLAGAVQYPGHDAGGAAGGDAHDDPHGIAVLHNRLAGVDGMVQGAHCLLYTSRCV